MLSYLKQDFEINKSTKNRIIMFTYRLGSYLKLQSKKRFTKIMLTPIYRILDFVFIQIIAGSEIPANCKIGKGFWIMHGAKGLIIHGDAVIGQNVRVFHQVTIGANDPRKEIGYGVPNIGDGVLIGAGAKIIGPITIGDNVRVGANAVVSRDVPSNCTAIGIPAVIKENKTQ